MSDLQNFGSQIFKAKVRYIRAQNNHEMFIKTKKKATGLLKVVHFVDSFKTHLKGCMFSLLLPKPWLPKMIPINISIRLDSLVSPCI